MLYDPKWEVQIAAPVDDWRLILLKAADLVRERGLAKGRQQDSEGRVCLHGAICIAATGQPHTYADAACEAGDRVVGYLVDQGVTYLRGCAGAAGWNNKPERTADEVIAILETVARLA